MRQPTRERAATVTGTATRPGAHGHGHRCGGSTRPGPRVAAGSTSDDRWRRRSSCVAARWPNRDPTVDCCPGDHGCRPSARPVIRSCSASNRAGEMRRPARTPAAGREAALRPEARPPAAPVPAARLRPIARVAAGSTSDDRGRSRSSCVAAGWPNRDPAVDCCPGDHRCSPSARPVIRSCSPSNSRGAKRRPARTPAAGQEPALRPEARPPAQQPSGQFDVRCARIRDE